MNNKLDMTIGAVGSIVVMKIHYMDERFRSKGIINGSIIFTASNWLQVCSDCRPALHSNSIYLWGSDNERDCLPSTREFSSPEAAQEYVDKVLFALKEWAAEWEGWDDDEESVPNQNDRYTF